jgi:hypothetical protein
MKQIVLLGIIAMLSGCSTIANIKDMVPSFWDDNQSAAAINIRQSVDQLDCTKEHLPQVIVIRDKVQWLDMYSESKGTNDVRRLLKPMQETVEDFYKRSSDKQGTVIYCNFKKKIMIVQSSTIATAIHRRF